MGMSRVVSYLVVFVAGFLTANVEYLSKEFLPSGRSVTSTVASQEVKHAAEEHDSAFDAIVETEVKHAAEEHNSAFDAIVETAYKEAFEEPAPGADKSRPVFDVNYWENESGLTTDGGLQHKDRILLGEIYQNATSLFEYGLGESTYMANYLNVPRYAGIDSDPVWVGNARSKVSSDFRFYLADIGATGAWGHPARMTSKAVLNYQLAPLIVEPKAFDVYMVDGRFRLACALASFLHASARGGDPSSTTVLIHDCKNPRDYRRMYDNADHLLEMKHSGDRLCAYKRKPTTTDEQLLTLWHSNYKNIKR